MRNFTVTDEVRDYAAEHGSRPADDVVRRLRARTQSLGDVAGMQIGDDQGQLLTMTGYADYWEELVPRVRAGGVLLVDNVLWSGRVVDKGVTDDDTVALRTFNDLVAADARVEAVVLTAFDGLTIARKL